MDFETTSASSPASGYYADKADIENVYGVENVRIWSQLEPGSTGADEARIGSALVYADRKIESMFSDAGLDSPPVNATTTEWAAIIAGDWLRQSRPEPQDDAAGSQTMNRAMKEIIRYLSGLASFASQKRYAPGV